MSSLATDPMHGILRTHSLNTCNLSDSRFLVGIKSEKYAAIEYFFCSYMTGRIASSVMTRQSSLAWVPANDREKLKISATLLVHSELRSNWP